MTFDVPGGFAGVDFGVSLLFFTGVVGLAGAEAFLGLFFGLETFVDSSFSGSKSDPLSSAPMDSPLGASAAPPETAFSSFGSNGSIAGASSSPAVAGLSGLMASDLVASFNSKVPLAALLATGSPFCSFAELCGASCFPEATAAPFVFGPSILPPSAPVFGWFEPPVTDERPSLLPMDSLWFKEGLMWPLLSTEMKLVRILRPLPFTSSWPAGDLPRDGGGVSSLFSNLALRSAMPAKAFPDMTGSCKRD